MQNIVLGGEVLPLTMQTILPLSVLNTTTTDAQGNFNFSVPEGGTYYISYFAIAPQSSYNAYPGKNPDTGLVNATKVSAEELEITLLTGESSIQNNFVLQSPATSATVRVYWDTDNNGKYQYGVDQLLSGVVVSMMEGTNQIAAGLTTAAGHLFSPMLAGSYTAQYVLPNGYLSTNNTKKSFTLTDGEQIDMYFPVQKRDAYDLSVHKSVDKLVAKP
ncbi:hypothetical protein FACS1894176_06290 [Bacteroidia bacterium]|nr:hypothetical protein FACS1894176_06290 [Bacteroidia bacterium]